jgi:hypothetical protein
LAQTSFLSQTNFSTLPYLEAAVASDAERLLIEKLLSVSVRVRFLDDRTQVLLRNDRKSQNIGYYSERAGVRAGKIDIRQALNKILHHDSLLLTVDERLISVFPSPTPTLEPKLIPLGNHKRYIVYLLVHGSLGKNTWALNIDLFALLNEIIRSIEHEA